MKFNRFLFVLASFMVLFAFTACSSDDDKGDDDGPAVTGNRMIYDGQDIPIKTMVIERGGTDWSDDGSREYYISLLSSEVVLVDGDFFPTQFPVSGFDLTLYSSGENRPKEGDYIFNNNYDIEFMCQDGMFVSNMTINPDNEFGADWDEFTVVSQGDFEIVKSGNTFEVEFEVSLLNGKMLKGHYKGGVLEFDEEDYDDWRPANSNKKFREVVRELQ